MNRIPMAPLKSLEQLDTKYDILNPAARLKISRLARIWQSPVVGAVFYTFLAALIILTVVLKGGNRSARPISLLGYAGLSVLTESMESEIPQGSFVLIKATDPDTLQVGDDITFLRTKTMNVTHRIIGIYEDYEETGERGFVTKGVDNDGPDNQIVAAEDVVGKVIFHSKPLGTVMSFINKNILLFAFSGLIIFGLSFLLRQFLIKNREASAPETNKADSVPR